MRAQHRQPASSRIAALDAVRGIAAFLVLLSHCYVTLPDALQASLALENTPLSLFVLGRPAVILFFVLSGFVLSLSLISPRAPSYPAFVVRRICRIYLPFAIAILVAAAARMLIQPTPIDALSTWFNSDWRTPVDLSLLLGHLAMLGTSIDMSLNNPIWSLVIEMRISLVFPLLLLLVGRSLKVTAVALLFCLVISELIARSPLLPRQAYSGETLVQGTLFTVYFVAYFVLGILLATQRQRITLIVQALHPWLRRLLWLAAIAGLGVSRDIVDGASAALIIALTIGSPGIQAWLCTPVLQWLGRISYSLYLTHVIVLLATIHLLYGTLPLAVLLPMVIVLALVVAHVFNLLVEQPAIALGRRLTRPQRDTASASASA